MYGDMLLSFVRAKKYLVKRKGVRNLGIVLGNVFALIIIVASSFLGFISLDVSSITYASISYLLWLIILLLSLFARPAKGSPIYHRLDPEEIDVCQRYYLYFWAVGVAEMLSSLLNALRFAGFIWGGLCLWNGLYWLGGAFIAYYFVTGGLILRLNPLLYMSGAAQKGNQIAIDQLSLIEAVLEKRKASATESDA